MRLLSFLAFCSEIVVLQSGRIFEKSCVFPPNKSFSGGIFHVEHDAIVCFPYQFAFSMFSLVCLNKKLSRTYLKCRSDEFFMNNIWNFQSANYNNDMKISFYSPEFILFG